MIWQRPTFIAKFQNLARQIIQFRGHFENRLGKNAKNRIASNKCDICTLDIITDFHWKHEANLWKSEICLIRSYADSLLSSKLTVNIFGTAEQVLKHVHARVRLIANATDTYHFKQSIWLALFALPNLQWPFLQQQLPLYERSFLSVWFLSCSLQGKRRELLMASWPRATTFWELFSVQSSSWSEINPTKCGRLFILFAWIAIVREGSKN